MGRGPSTARALTPREYTSNVAVPLGKLQPSPFYNMFADGKPVDKALTLLHFTQRGNGKQYGHGFRIITERVCDPTEDAAAELPGFATMA